MCAKGHLLSKGIGQVLIVFLQTSILRSCGGTYVATWIEMTYLS